MKRIGLMASEEKSFESVHDGQIEAGRRLPSYTIKSNRKAMNRNWGNQKANPALKTKAGNK